MIQKEYEGASLLSPTQAISWNEQEAMGLVRKTHTFIPAFVDKGLPPVQAVPHVIDPYGANLPEPVKQIVHFTVTPYSRAQAMVMKVSTVTLALAVFTLASMVVLAEFYFFLWLLLASMEWVGTFIVLAIIDYRETPAAQARMQLCRYLDMMEREQRARLRAMYGKEHVDP